jgi:hypothetical protein
MTTRCLPAAFACGLLLTACIPALAEPAATPPPEPPAEAWLLLRDPFWPVGFTPAPKIDPAVTKLETIRERIDWPRITLKGLTRTASGRHVAILDGVGLVESGDIVTIERGGLAYRWRIDEVTRRGIRTTRMDVRDPRERLQEPVE